MMTFKRVLHLDVNSPTVDLWKQEGKNVRVKMPGGLKGVLGLRLVRTATVMHLVTLYGPFGNRIEMTKEAFDQCLEIGGGSFRIPWTPRPPTGITYPLTAERP